MNFTEKRLCVGIYDLLVIELRVFQSHSFLQIVLLQNLVIQLTFLLKVRNLAEQTCLDSLAIQEFLHKEALLRVAEDEIQKLADLFNSFGKSP